ncbi:MAG: MarR family transcriptional regulator [Candidatus Brockarchaeota archaeon]|nr:MarR family transcriptional regulator [Candidatus Brockarchaeota archaeon]
MLRKTIVLVIPIFLAMLILQQSLPVNGEFEFQTNYRIILHKDSSATWIVELLTPLSSEEEKADFQEFMESANREYMLSSFKSTIDSMVDKASSTTGRLMRAEDFSLEIDIKGVLKQLGVIEYRFTWINFGIKTANTIEIGDVFEGGFYLFPDEMLEIDYSELVDDYFLKLISPTPSREEASKKIWFGKFDFSDGEPKLVFQSRVLTIEEFLPSTDRVEKGLSISIHGKVSPPVPDLIIQIVYRNPNGLETVREVAIGENGYFSDNYTPNITGLWSVSVRLPPDSKYKISGFSQPLEFSVYEKSGETEGLKLPPITTLLLVVVVLLIIVSTLLLLYRRRRGLPPPPEEYMVSDEELILRILRNSGGKLAQKQIKEATGFSKSKTSMVLNELQKKGLIRKIKRGREYIVELV